MRFTLHNRPRIALAALLGLLAGLAPHPGPLRAACCYFAAQEKDIHQPGQKAFLQWRPDEGIESFTVQPKFEGNAVDFGMVIPTPGQPKLDEMPRDFFKDLAIYTILLPLPEPIHPFLYPVKEEAGGVAFDAAAGSDAERAPSNRGVRILEAGVVGSLDYKVITAERSDGLFEWLKENAYSYSGDEGTLEFYVQKKWFFTVMKIDPKQMKKAADGSYTGEVTPTRFTFETRECIYPLKITQISVKDVTDALFYVQAPAQMDLQGDWSWMHSYRPMYLQFLLGCGATTEEQKELRQRTEWVTARKRKDPRFETTKLEWAKELGEAELAVLDDPAAHYAQGGGGDLPRGARILSVDEFLAEVWSEYEKTRSDKSEDDYARQRLQELRDQYGTGMGRIVRNETPSGFQSRWMWYPDRQAPPEEVRGLSRLKGHLQKGQWLTKFRKQIRKDEMADDLVLLPIDAGRAQTYVRILPTSPP